MDFTVAELKEIRTALIKRKDMLRKDMLNSKKWANPDSDFEEDKRKENLCQKVIDRCEKYIKYKGE